MVVIASNRFWEHFSGNLCFHRSMYKLFQAYILCNPFSSILPPSKKEIPINREPATSSWSALASVPSGNSEYSDSNAKNMNNEPKVNSIPNRKRLQTFLFRSCMISKAIIATQNKVVNVFPECQLPPLSRMWILLCANIAKSMIYQTSGKFHRWNSEFHAVKLLWASGTLFCRLSEDSASKVIKNSGVGDCGIIRGI